MDRSAVDVTSGDEHAGRIARRSPFSSSGQVGARGQRTQQRILDGALQAFGEDGYRRCGIARIAESAGCSRASFYQYFSSKEDVFRQLAGAVARQLMASAEALPPLTGDEPGWVAVHQWVVRHRAIYERYEPVFRVFQAAAESDPAIASGSARAGERIVAMVSSRLDEPPLPPRQLAPLIRIWLECLSRTYDIAAVLSVAAPGDVAPGRMDTALADVVHRTLFGYQATVNVHPPGPPPPAIELPVTMRDVLASDDAPAQLSPAARQTLATLLEAGRDVFARQGYDATRVDDVAAAAGVSRGAFYRHFRNQDHLAQVLGLRAMRTVSDVLNEIPRAGEDGLVDSGALRSWVRRYSATAAKEAAVLRVWVDASYRDPALRGSSAAAIDWGRRRLVQLLSDRDVGGVVTGDVEVEAIVGLGLLHALGGQEPSAAEIDAAAFIIDRGLLGQ